jgi:hypothetical protein
MNADHLYSIQARKASHDDPPHLLQIRHRDLRDAVYHYSEWLKQNFGEIQTPQRKDGGFVRGPPVALLLDSDVGLLFHMLRPPRVNNFWLSWDTKTQQLALLARPSKVFHIEVWDCGAQGQRNLSGVLRKAKALESLIPQEGTPNRQKSSLALECTRTDTILNRLYLPNLKWFELGGFHVRKE